MTTQQLLAFLVIGIMMAGFIWGRFRYDIVALVALLLSIAVGIVEPSAAFSGFSDDIVIIVGSALVVSAAVSRSGIMEVLLRRLAPDVRGPRAQLILLVLAVTLLSAFVKNIGALAIMIPIAFQFARRSGVSPSMFLMPMSFGSLLGGLMTQVGTSPNIIVSRVREDLTGTPFSMFDFTPAGLTLAAAGVVFLTLFYWLVPKRTRQTSSMDEAVTIKNYTTEATVLEGTPLVGGTVGDLQKLGEGLGMVTRIIDSNGHRKAPFPDAALHAGDVVILEGQPQALDAMVAQGMLQLSERRSRIAQASDETGTVEAIVGEKSPLVGESARNLALFDRTGLNLLAISRRNQRLTERLGDVRIQRGDVLVLQGDINRLPELLRDWDCLPLVERGLRLGAFRNGVVPLMILLAAMAATALGLVPVAVAFFAAAVLMVLSRALPLRDVYHHLDAPILVMLAALIPVSDSLRTTGATDIIAAWLSATASVLPPFGALALIMLAAMAVTPFLNNAATVLVMAPIAATFATDLGFRPEAFLMAVAIGAGCDFLTPIGHQCNTLVMGPGGYRFGDYWRLGLPLSVLVVVVGVPTLMLVWPMV